MDPRAEVTFRAIRRLMTKNDLARRLAVCSWSLQPTSPQELIAAVAASAD